LLIDATEGASEIHVTDEVISALEPSEYTPVAVNCTVVPSTAVGAAGVILITSSVAAVTVTGALADVTEPIVAVMLVVPTLMAVTIPLLPATLLTVALVVLLDVHVAADVTSMDVPSE